MRKIIRKAAADKSRARGESAHDTDQIAVKHPTGGHEQRFDRLASGKQAIAAGVKEAGLWHRLFGDDLHKHEAAVYNQTIEHGGMVVSARVLDSYWTVKSPTLSQSSTFIARSTCMTAR
jgi:hypothetical protein